LRAPRWIGVPSRRATCGGGLKHLDSASSAAYLKWFEGEGLGFLPVLSEKEAVKRIMEILTAKITAADLKSMAEKMFGNLVKVVVDVRLRKMAVDAELHSDEESLLIEAGSRQQDLWGINVYPDIERKSPDFIEFDSMINLRPSQGNKSRGVDDAGTREKIIAVVDDWIA
jgi:hypothetical protein